MDSLFKHSLRLTLPNLLGYLLASMVSFIGYLVFILFSFLATGDSAFVDATMRDQLPPLESLEPVAIVIVLIGFFLYLAASLVGQAIMTAGTFGSSISTVYHGESSINDYFSQAGRHLWKMTLLQLAWILVLVPIVIPVIVISLILTGAGDAAAAAGVLLLIIFVILTVYLYAALYFYSPVLIIRKGMGVWKSIGTSIRIAFKKPGQTLITLLANFGILLAVGLVFLIIFFALGGAAFASMESGGAEVGAVGFILFILLLLAAIFFVFPFVYAMTHLIIVMRFKEYIEPGLLPERPDSGQGDDSEPVFDIKKNQ